MQNANECIQKMCQQNRETNVMKTKSTTRENFRWCAPCKPRHTMNVIWIWLLFAKPMNFSHFNGNLWLKYANSNAKYMHWLRVHLNFAEMGIIWQRGGVHSRKFCMHIHRALALRQRQNRDSDRVIAKTVCWRCPFNSMLSKSLPAQFIIQPNSSHSTSFFG